MIGPNILPMRSTPWRWIENSSTSIDDRRGQHEVGQPGAATPRPSMAPSTEIAGRHHAVAEEQRGAEDAEDAQA